MKELPIPPALLDWLDEQIPSQEPRPGDSMDEIMYYAGRRSVVLLLKRRKKLQDGKGNLKDVEADPDVRRQHV